MTVSRVNINIILEYKIKLYAVFSNFAYIILNYIKPSKIELYEIWGRGGGISKGFM